MERCREVRHIEVSQLWIQDKVARGEIEVIKIPGKTNIADALTKYVGSEELRRHVDSSSHQLCSGRHELSPSVAEDTNDMS